MKSTIITDCERQIVKKICRSEEEFQNEIRGLSLGLPFTPQLYSAYQDKVVEMELIDGETLSDNNKLDFSKLALLFSGLHAATAKQGKALCHLDTNPKNYIIQTATGRYYMIDFSESGYSVAENDLVNFLLFFAAMYEPERFADAMKILLKSYSSKKLADKTRKPLFNCWMEIFDRRRQKYGKNRGLNQAQQEVNRKHLQSFFYQHLLGG